jgi:hypothetical protein
MNRSTGTSIRSPTAIVHCTMRSHNDFRDMRLLAPIL